MAATVRNLIERARVRHWSFTDVNLNDGAALEWLNARQQHLMLRFAEALRGILGTTVESATLVSGVLVGVTPTGTPQYLTSFADGWPVHVNANGVPYVNIAEPKVAGDPFGQYGGTPGFPLPSDFVAVQYVALTYDDGTTRQVTLVDEKRKHERLPDANPSAFISANRLVPIRPPMNNTTGDRWIAVASVQLSYFGLPQLTTLSDAILLPVVLHEPLVAGLTELFAMQSKDCPANEKAAFAAAARRADAENQQISFDMLGDVRVSSIVYRG